MEVFAGSAAWFDGFDWLAWCAAALAGVLAVVVICGVIEAALDLDADR